MKDYAKIVREPPRDLKPRPQKPGLARTAIDKNHQAQEAASSKKLLYIVIALIFAVVLVSAYRQHLHKASGVLVKTTQSTASSQASGSSPQFDFYSVLPSGNNPQGAPTTPTSVAETAAAGAATPPAATPAAPTTTPVATPVATPIPAPGTNPTVAAAPSKYYLSAGSFPNSGAAQQTLSQLLLLGVDAKVVTVQNNGSPAYQVEVGPFSDQDTLNIVKQQLTSHDIPVSVISQ